VLEDIEPALVAMLETEHETDDQRHAEDDA
jgi:hypothetical protein